MKQLLQEYYDQIEIPDESDSWQKVLVHLEKRRRQEKRRFRFKIAAAIIAGVLLVEVALTVNIPKTYASVSSLFREVRESIIEFFFAKTEHQDNSAALTTPPEESNNGTTSIPEETTLDDAAAKLMFSLLIPEYVPENYMLDVVRIFQEADGEYHNAYLEYVNDVQDLFKISQRYVEPGSTDIKSDVAVDAGTIKETTIHGNAAVCVMLPEGFVNLEWLAKDIKISISGKLTEAEVLLIAESMHPHKR